MTAQYYVEEFQDDDDNDEDPTWDALDWAYMVKASGDDIICICATQQEAEHIAKLLREQPYETPK